MVGIPVGRGLPLNVTTPPGEVLYPESPFVDVAVHVSETPTVPGEGKQDTITLVEV